MARSEMTDRLSYLRLQNNQPDPLSSTLYPPLHRLPLQFDTHVKAAEEGRPALISYNYYRTVDLYWVVMEYNGFMHHLELIAGTRLRLPSIEVVRGWLLNAKVVAQRAATDLSQDGEIPAEDSVARRRILTL